MGVFCTHRFRIFRALVSSMSVLGPVANPTLSHGTHVGPEVTGGFRLDPVRTLRYLYT